LWKQHFDDEGTTEKERRSGKGVMRRADSILGREMICPDFLNKISTRTVSAVDGCREKGIWRKEIYEGADWVDGSLWPKLQWKFKRFNADSFQSSRRLFDPEQFVRRLQANCDSRSPIFLQCSDFLGTIKRNGIL
jgi:hypothetical protein